MRTFLTLLMLILSGAPVHAQNTTGWTLVPDESQLTFTAISTLHKVHGDAGAVSGELKEEGGIAAGAVDVPVVHLETHNLKRDKNMYTMFDAPRYPAVRVAFQNTDLRGVLAGQAGRVVFHGTMTIRNVTNPVTLVCAARRAGDRLTFDGNTVVHLKDFHLKPPSAVFGAIRVQDTVDVHYTLVFTGKGAAHENG